MASQIVITGWMDYEPSERDFVLKHFTEVARISRTEPGCIDYAVTADIDDNRRVRVVEHWESEETLYKHLETEHVSQFRAAVANCEPVGRNILKHVIASSGPMRSRSAGS